MVAASNIVSTSMRPAVSTFKADGTENIMEFCGVLLISIHDKYGYEVATAKLGKVYYMKGQWYNLFSTTKLQLTGRCPDGDRDSLWFNHCKVDFSLKFAIKILMPKGCVFLAYFC
jgi:hypothetical protein